MDREGTSFYQTLGAGFHSGEYPGISAHINDGNMAFRDYNDVDRRTDDDGAYHSNASVQ